MIRFALLLMLCASSCFGTDPDYTFAVIPDPQYLQFCTAVYSNMMTWIVNNRTLSVGGGSLNIKAVIGVGDLEHTAGSETTATTAWTILDTAGIPWVAPAGNHDINDGGALGASGCGDGTGTFPPCTERSVRAFCQAGGFFGGDTRAGKSQYNTTLPGGGGSAAGITVYDSGGGLNYDAQNYYLKLTIGTRNIILASLEFNPRSIVLNWLKAAHDANPSYEMIVSTHSYMQDQASQTKRNTSINAGTNGTACQTTDSNMYVHGPDSYLQGAAPLSNSGCEMWNGSDGTWAGFKGWSNLTLVMNGHHLYNVGHTTGPQAPYYTVVQPVTSTSVRAQTVQQLFTNYQELEGAMSLCSGGVPNAGLNSGHVTLLKFRPSLNTLEVYTVATNSGNWASAGPTLSYGATPVLIANIAYSGIAPLPATSISGSVSVSGAVVIK